MKFIRKHIWWFVGAGLVLYFWPAGQAQANTVFVPGGGAAGSGATGSW